LSSPYFSLQHHAKEGDGNNYYRCLFLLCNTPQEEGDDNWRVIITFFFSATPSLKEGNDSWRIIVAFFFVRLASYHRLLHLLCNSTSAKEDNDALPSFSSLLQHHQ